MYSNVALAQSALFVNFQPCLWNISRGISLIENHLLSYNGCYICYYPYHDFLSLDAVWFESIKGKLHFTM